MKKVELSERRGLISTIDKGELYSPSINNKIPAMLRYLHSTAKGAGADFAPYLLLHLILSVQRINRNNQGETIGYKCSYTEIAKYLDICCTTAVKAAKWLERNDWLTITIDGKTSVFNLNLEKINYCLKNPRVAACGYDDKEMWAALLPNRTCL